MDTLTIDENDFPFEEEVLRHPYSMLSWNRYIEYKASRKNVNPNDLYMIYERALQQMPYSYKLWNNYLRLRRTHMLTKPISDVGYGETNAAHEKALLFMHKMPRIWIEYCKFLFHQRLVTKTRETFDESLRAIPITQHYRIWPLYIRFGNFVDIASTTSHIYARYIKIYPENIEDYIDFLLKNEKYDEAADHIIQLINNRSFQSKHNKTRFQFIYQLCELITQHPQQLNNMSIPNIIRSTIDKFTDGNGQLWCMLANYYIQIGGGMFESARDIFEEAINKVMTVKDFGQIFDTYVQFEEAIISSKVENVKKIERQQSSKSRSSGSNKSSKLEADKFDLELRLERLEYLIDRRAVLLSSVLLRQNPHNVNEWLKRANLFQDLDAPNKVIETYEQAIATVDCRYAVGSLSQLWIEYANFHLNTNKNIQQARTIYERAIDPTTNFRYVEDLVAIWCHYAEMEISNGGNIDLAFRLMERATAVPSKKAKVKYFDQTETIHNRLFKSLRLWCFYCDLSENYATFEATKSIYNQIMTMKIANPQLVLNFTSFLESHSYFEESFKEFERAIELFHWPNVYDIWNTYLIKFVHRYGSSKLERIRDLFEQVLSNCPKKFSKWFYLAYAQVEENYGLTKNAIAIYERAIDNVADNEKYQMFTIYINRCVELVGLTCTRPIFDKAIECLPNQSALKIGLRYVALETKLGEIDRSRSICNYLAQMADPKVNTNFWNAWQEFEVNHGNPETFREMRRIRRTMLSHFHTKINVSLIHKQEEEVDPMQAVEELEANAIAAANERDKLKEKISFVKATDQTNLLLSDSNHNNNGELLVTDIISNPNEINLDDDDDDLEKKQIPREVFGGLVK